MSGVKEISRRGLINAKQSRIMSGRSNSVVCRTKCIVSNKFPTRFAFLPFMKTALFLFMGCDTENPALKIKFCLIFASACLSFENTCRRKTFSLFLLRALQSYERNVGGSEGKWSSNR